MSAVMKPRYYAPTVHKSVTVSLADFSDDDIAKYMALRKSEGKWDASEVAEEGDLVIRGEELDRLATLVLCGQRAYARDWLLEVVGKQIGRSLKEGA